MATKSVIEIDVLDEKFKSFQQQFEKYKKALEKMPKDWEKVNKSISLASKAQNDFNKALGDGYTKLRSVAGITATIASNLASAAVSVAKWVALGAIGGGFGLGGLASSATSLRRTAGGLGVSPGALTSARTYLSPYMDADTVLANIAALRNTAQGRAIFGRLGGQVGQKTEEALPTLLRRAVGMYKQFGGEESVLKQFGALDVADLTTLRRLSGLQGTELEDALNQYAEGVKKFALKDKDLVSWQKFLVGLDEAGNLIKKSLIANLPKLGDAFKTLSTSVSEAINKFLESENFGKFVNYASEQIKKFGEYLGSEEFQTDVKTFFDALKALGDAIVKTAQFLGLIPQSKEQKEARTPSLETFRGEVVGTNESLYDKAANYIKSRPMLRGKVNLSQRDQALAMMLSAGYNKEAALGFLGGLQQESGFNENIMNPQTKEHYGVAQWSKERKADFEAWAGKSIYGSSFKEQMQFILYELQNKEKRAGDILRSGTSREAGVAANLAFERPALEGTEKWAAEFNTRLGIANKYQININNNTGNAVTVTTPAMNPAPTGR